MLKGAVPVFEITKDFIGANIRVIEKSEHEVVLKNELRDTNRDWFYWAFCVKGAEGKTIKFRFDEKNRVGHFGAAVSADLENWAWTEGRGEDESFTYTFKEGESCLYFAHHMLYHPKRFFDFAKKSDICIKTLCISEKGNPVPFCTIGSGSNKVILTARHHCCESSGSYVLEGVLSGLLENPIKDYEFFCVPFVDYEGVIAGDQGKDRQPYDHNRDYDKEQEPIYNETREIRKYALSNNVVFAFDFHSPWHKGGKDDFSFIVHSSGDKFSSINHFAGLFEHSITKKSFGYHKENDIPSGVSWNKEGTPCFGQFMDKLPSNNIAFTLEMPYFGNYDNIISQENAVELGRCFVKALRAYIAEAI